ncbi:hypothetical protein Tco_1444773, partial [Tanacetum coccineum]
MLNSRMKFGDLIIQQTLVSWAKPPCFFTEDETEYLKKRIQDGKSDIVQ